MKKFILKILDAFVRYRDRLRIDIENNNIYDETNGFQPGCFLFLTKWGKHSTCNSNSTITKTTIGNYCSIAHNVTIGPRNHIFTNFTTHDCVYKINKEHLFNSAIWDDTYCVKIGHDVWVGAYSIILHGVEVGNGAIVATGSVVTSSVPPYAIVAGNPARIIRYRFSREQIAALERTNWFEWDIPRILEERDKLENIVNFDLADFIQREKQPRKFLS